MNLVMHLVLIILINDNISKHVAHISADAVEKYGFLMELYKIYE